jgi:hypothetical protein
VDAGQLGLHLGRGSDWFDLRDLPQTVANGSNRSSGWSVRFKGTAKRVLRNWFAARYWAGEIEVPLAGLIRRSAPPPRAK